MPNITAETVSASEARQHFASLLNNVFRNKTRVVIEKSGIPVAVLISTDDLERLERLNRQRDERAELIERFRAPFRDVDPDELQRELDHALAEVRAEMKAEREASTSRS